MTDQPEQPTTEAPPVDESTGAPPTERTRTKVRAVPLLTDTDERVRERAVAAVVAAAPDSPLGRFAPDWVNGIPNPRTAELNAKLVARWFRWCAAKGISPEAARPRDARIYHAAMSKLAPKSKAMCLSACRRFYEEAMDEDIVATDPFRRVVERKPHYRTQTPALTEVEFERVLAHIQSYFEDPRLELAAFRDYTIVYLMGRIGFRRREAWKMRWGDMTELADRFATIHVVGKWETSAEVILPDDVVAALAAWRARLAEAIGRPIRPTDPLFVSAPWGVVEVYPDGSLVGLSLFTVGDIVRSRFADAGIRGKRYNSHALRATAATIAHEHGADLEAICAQLRHASLDQSRGYIRRWKASQLSGALTWGGPDGHDPDGPARAAVRA